MMLWQATGAPLPSWDWGHARRSDSQPKPALPTGCRGRTRRSGTWPVLPAHWGPALLWRAAGAPYPPGAGVARFALARPEPPLPTGGLGSSMLPWRRRSSPGPWWAGGTPARAFDIKCQPELSLVDVLYQSLSGWLLVHD